MNSILTLDLSLIPTEVILINKDYIESLSNTSINTSYKQNMVMLSFENDIIKNQFEDSMSDYILRYQISNKYHSIKEIIIGRALYGIVDELR